MPQDEQNDEETYEIVVRFCVRASDPAEAADTAKLVERLRYEIADTLMSGNYDVVGQGLSNRSFLYPDFEIESIHKRS